MSSEVLTMSPWSLWHGIYPLRTTPFWRIHNGNMVNQTRRISPIHAPSTRTNSFTTTHDRHLALQSRNPLAHSAFIYSVVTTKIYCRPTCPSRLARRSNIVFHDTAKQAAADGFRPCKRCCPDKDIEDAQTTMVRRVCELIKKEAESGEKWSVKALSREVGLTESHFCRMFKRTMGKTVGKYRQDIATERMEAVPWAIEAPASSEAISPDILSCESSGNLGSCSSSATNYGEYGVDQFVLDEAAYREFITSAINMDHFPSDMGEEDLHVVAISGDGRINI